MAETFYSVLGVGTEAKAGEIEQAYRERVKQCHPDVSSDGNARRKFKRVTVAKETLVTDAERERYDRLGHDAYVRHHVESPVWTASKTARGAVDTSSGSTTASRPGGAERSTAKADGARRATGQATGAATGSGSGEKTRRTSTTGSYARGGTLGGFSAVSGDDGRSPANATATVYAGGATDFWRAHDPSTSSYGRSSSDPVARRAFDALEAAGGWLVVHLAFVASMLLTGWLFVTSPTLHPDISLGVFVLWIGLLPVSVALSVLHLIWQIYT